MEVYLQSLDQQHFPTTTLNTTTNTTPSLSSGNGGGNNSWGGNNDWGGVDVTRLVGVTPLHFAVRAGRNEVVKVLMGMEEDEDEQEESSSRYEGGGEGGASTNYHHHNSIISSSPSPGPSPGLRSIARWVDSMETRSLHPLLLYALTEGVGQGLGGGGGGRLGGGEVEGRDENMSYISNPHHHNHHHSHGHNINDGHYHYHHHHYHDHHSVNLLARRAVRAGSRMVYPAHNSHPLAHAPTSGGGGSYGMPPPLHSPHTAHRSAHTTHGASF